MNVFALQLTQGRPIVWQSPLAALLDALQPGIVEEVIYRFALLGLLWLALHKSMPRQAAWLAGLLALLAHTLHDYEIRLRWISTTERFGIVKVDDNHVCEMPMLALGSVEVHF